ncbi:MAG: lectin-like protein, partial [Limisphaerales bacterium]
MDGRSAPDCAPRLREASAYLESNIRNRVIKMALGICLLAGGIATSFAGYTIKTQVETVAGVNRYTWTVYNQDQSWGLDMFAIEVPAQLKVLAYTVPTPYSNPDRTAYWIMQERQDAWIDPHDARVILPAAQTGRKWLFWWGMESPSVYPPGTTVTFSITADASVKTGHVRGFSATYTPQNNPHYYAPWPEEVLAPSAVATDAAAPASAAPQPTYPGILAGPIVNPANGHSYYLLTQSTWSNAEAQAVRLGGHLATIRNADEDRWVFTTFGGYGGALWIGLTDRQKAFQFTWASGEPVLYTNWGGGQPDNG